LTIQVLLLMGGLGTRFASAGYSTPKPLLLVDGEPMFRKAISSFDPLKTEVSLFAAVRAEHEYSYGLGSLLSDEGMHVTYLHENTRGAAETALQAVRYLNPESPLIVVDCDLHFRSPELFSVLEKKSFPFDGGLTFFESKDPRYSFAEIDSHGVVVRTAEKNPISNKALIGCYAFRTASIFSTASEELVSQLKEGSDQEVYMSAVYNVIIKNGAKVLGYPGSFDSFGTPEELILYSTRTDCGS